MTRAFSVFFGLMCLLLGSCTQRMVCPAYQSAFIYDKDELRKKFSYFQEDSTPKIYTASKNKYLIAEPVSYQRKVRSLRTVQMKPVPVHVPDSLSGKGKGADSVSMADFERAAKSIRDTTMIVDVPQAPADSVSEPLDSIYVITKDREVRLLKYNTPDSLLYDSVLNKWVPQIPKYYIADVRYNVTQDNYMWYLRDALILPDVRIAKMQQAGGGAEEGEEKAAGKEKRKGLGLKGLFKKKPKEAVDSTATQTPAEDEFDFIEEADTVSQAEVPQPGQEEKKPSRREKKPKVKKVKKPKKDKKQPEQPEVTPEEKKKEDDDDGF
ncbi:hypothetical protein KK083_11430 [Fulvivirgaceae bacterium PWU4]|uniref:Uncharacterized protein n=1 Tax=Chryseosolibacter histidini TaxID=2782349 RepID=A0AAP2DJL0_9BACT|nr:hypothetical protein [Chryseosolibacter histidini]MBT1697490.1 hypothetical protein [Chryseosolibacter histidini]